MCGIAGKVILTSGRVEEDDITKMTSKIVHRGPDDSGVFISDNKKVGLGTRRLAIIDLSSKGHQPMFYQSARYVITTNGEIYNFRSEREKLKRLGYRFHSDCDTEVILALYDHYGEKCLNYLRGMFAFCIYDTHKKTLFLARDRIGKKPLKYFFDGNTFIFSSEVKAILTQKEVKKTPDFVAIAKYLSYGYIPSPYSGFSGIKKLPPGHFIKINLNKKSFDLKRYWEPVFRNKLQLSERQWTEKILKTLIEAVSLRMIADVPLGAFLSGGVDSSAIVAIMAQLSKKRVKTFTVSFKDKVWDESKFAKNISDLYDTDHNIITIGEQKLDILPEICASFEEPFADAGVILSYLISNKARAHVKVILNGDGGDEIFAGYPNRYTRLKRDVDFFEYINLVRPAAVFGLRALNSSFKTNFGTNAQKFFEKSKLPLYQKFASYNQIFSPEEIVSISKGDLAQNLSPSSMFSEVEECFSLFKGRDEKDAGLKFDLLYWLPDDLLAKADMSSMASSLEGRSPLLDTQMLELTGKIPFNLKVKKGETKYIFKKALEKIVPKENLYRQKRGFGMPLHKWFKGKKHSFANNVLLGQKAKVASIINKYSISKMLSQGGSSEDFGPRLFSLVTLELWMREYFS